MTDDMDSAALSSLPPDSPFPLLMAPRPEAELVYVDTQPVLLQAATRMSQEPRVALDLEGDSAYHYLDRICLLQASIPGVDYIIDTLALSDLSCLRPVIEDPLIEKILHSADNDLPRLQRWYGWRLRHLFDTRLAAMAVGIRRLGLADLAAECLHLKLDKEFQRFNWSLRPLLPEHLHYARCDTHFLPAIRDLLWQKVEARGRQSQALEEFQRLENREFPVRPFSPEDYIRVPGAEHLPVTHRGVAKALYVWRDKVARDRDLPPGRILDNRLLILLSQLVPQNLQALSTVQGIHPRLVRLHGREIVALVRDGLRHPIPAAPRDNVHRPDIDWRAIEDRVRKLKVWRGEKAQVLELAPEVIATNAVLVAVAREAPKSLETLGAIPEVRKWQVSQFGEEWLQVLNRPEPG